MLILFVFCSCDDASKEAAIKNDSLVAAPQKLTPSELLKRSTPDQQGIVGVFDVPEMLSLCKLDSAEMKDVPDKITKNFAILEKDLEVTKSQADASQGIIYYNGSSKNLKFECFLLIKQMPTIKPVGSQIVILEAEKMLIYNYYGSYEFTYKAYKEINEYCGKNNLEQSGPLREFYPINQGEQQDQTKWFTRIMVPVRKKTT